MAYLVYLLYPNQLYCAAVEGGQYGFASFVRSSTVNVRGQYKTTFFQGYQGNGYRKVGDLYTIQLKGDNLIIILHFKRIFKMGNF